MPRIIHFEIPAEKPERATGFYQTVFGWQSEKWSGPEDYWMIRTGSEGPGIDGGLMVRKHPQQPVTNVIDVPNIDDYCARVTAADGEIVVPKMEVPGVGYLAYFKDTEGNIFGMMQMHAG